MNTQKNGKEIILNGGIKRIFAIIFMIIFVVCAILYANKKSIINNQSYLADAETLKTLTYGELNDEDIKVNNCANIEFSAFFVKDTDNDGYAEKYKGSCKPVNSTDELYINLNLLSGGRLENGKIEVKSSNFKYNLNMVKDSVLKYNYISENVKEIYLNNIDAGTQKLIIGNIKSDIGTDINNYSRTDNAIILKGTYVLEDGTRIEINETRNLAVDWYGSVSTGINTTYVNFDYSRLKESNLNFQINVKEYNKTLLLQESGVKAVIPELGGYAPKSVKCLNAEYSYNEETKELIITRTSTCTEEGIITNIISRDNIYNILIEYPEEAYDAVSEGTIISVPVEAYYKGYNNPSKEFSNPNISTNKRDVSLILKAVPTGEVCNIFVDYQDKKVANKPYKRNVVSKQNIINAYNSENKENIEFSVKWTAIRGSEGNVNAVKISETKTNDKYGDVWGSTVMDEYISNTGLYFDNPTNMLGEDGKIFIYDNDTNELIETLTSKDWNTYYASNPYKYSAPVKHIRIETTNANVNSTLTIYCIKEIDIEKLTKDYTKEQIENIDYIATRVTGKFFIADENNGEDANSNENSSENSSENNGEDTNNNENSSENGSNNENSGENNSNDENANNNENSNGKETVINNIDQVNFVSEKSYAYLGATQTKFSSQENVKNQKIYINATKQEEYDAKWKDGQFIIKMPKEFINLSINNIAVNNSNVEILGYTVYEKEGNYYIKIITQNTNPETYSITIDYNAVINPRTTTSTNNLSLWYYNKLADDYYYTAKDYYDVNSNNQTNDNVGFASMQCKFLAPTGIISFETVTEYNEEQEETIAPNKAEIDKNVKQAKINVELINNYKNAVSNIEMLGKIPFEGNKFTISQSSMNSDFTTTMTQEGISIPEEIKQYTKVYYSENDEPSKDINDEQNGWKLAEDIENFDNIKTYLITINNYDINSGRKYKFSYKINIPENLEYNQTAYSSHAIYYELNTSEGKLKDYLEVSKVGIRVARKYNFDVYKYKEGTTRPVEGSTYELIEQNAEGEIINRNLITTTQEGRMYLEGLYVDSIYTFKEISASADYKINDDEIQFKVEEKEENASDEQNQLDASGKLELTIISEDNFANTAILEKDENGKETLKAKVEDEPKYEVIITNRDAETSKVITDLMVSTNSNFYFTDQNGIITIPRLEQNAQYTLTQLRSKEYYLNEDINFKLYKDNEGNLKIESNSENFTNARIEDSDNQNLIKVYVNTTNEKIPTYNLEIIKTEEKTDKKLSGAKFKVSSTDLQTKRYYTTENEGNIILNGLYKYVEGKNITGEYEIEEVIAPKGYCLNSEKIKFKAVQNEEGLNLEIENRENLVTIQDVQIEENTIKLILKDKPLFKLVKKDAETGEPLSNAKFIIYELNENNEMVDYAKDANGNYIAEKTNYTVTTDENGEIRLPLRAGKYKTIEVGYPENYEEKGGTEYFEVEDTNKEEEETEEISETDAFTYDENLQIDEVYEINYIEELLKYYKSSNPSYSDVVLKLQRTLDFNEDDSYLNKDDTSYGDLNGDGAVEGIKEELTKKSGTGMPQIRIYQGEFDGQGHELRNIYINSTSQNVSVFDSETTTVLIKNLGITGEINATYEGTQNTTYRIGAFSSKAIGSIVNCYNKANINVNVNETNEDNLASFFIGGIVGAAGTMSIQNSYNEGNITFSGNFGYHYIGGITGGTAGGTPGLKIENAYNKGNIEVNKVISETAKTIIGMIGGIVGNNHSSTIKNSYNIGNINTNHNNSMIGSIAGYTSQNTINSFYLDTIEVTGGNINAVGTAKSEEEMKSDEFVSELGFYWKKYANENNEYPMINKEYEGIMINYIEDLVELSKDTTGSRLTGSYYYRVPINLNRTLNFEDDSSYKDPTYTSYGDLNGNGEIEDIKTELTNKNGIGFIPIGGYDFCPIIDGHGYEIQNIYINSGAENIALISQMGKGEIKNLGITGEIKSYNSSARLAGILAYNSGFGFYRSGSLVIENCYNKTNLSGNASNVGGILGYSDYSILRIKCCHNEGNISIAKNTYSNIGGIIGYNELRSSEEALSGIIKSYNKGAISAEANSIGGIAGEVNISLIECYNEGIIRDSTATYIGGLIGKIHNRSSNMSTIYKSYNKSDININIKGVYIGGLIGWGATKAILGSYNEGDIITYGSHNAVGGIIGYSFMCPIIDHCYNQGKIEINSASFLGGLCGYLYVNKKISYSYNLGDIKGNSSSSGDWIGGIAGNSYYEQAIHLYNEGNITIQHGGRYIGGIFGYKNGGNDTCLRNNGNIDIVNSFSVNNEVNIGGIIGAGSGQGNELQNTGNINASVNAEVYAGGIVGGGSQAIINGSNTGKMNISCKGGYIGGIRGYYGSKIDKSYNEGDINVNNTGMLYVGGIANGCTTNTSYNKGNIYVNNMNGAVYSGGILGLEEKQITDCYNKGDIKIINGHNYCFIGGLPGYGSKSINTYNTGNIDAENCTIFTSGSMGNSYYLNTVDINGIKDSSYGNQKIQFVSDEYMKSEEFYNTLNTNNVWIRCQDNYPILNVAIPSNISKATEIEVENTIKKYQITANGISDEEKIGGKIEGTNEEVKPGESNKNEYKFIPDEDYEIEYVRINGINQELNLGEDRTYTIKPEDLNNIQEDKHIIVKFKKLDNLTIKKVDVDNEDITLENAKFEIQEKKSQEELIKNMYYYTTYKMLQSGDKYISNNRNISNSNAATRFELDLTDIEGTVEVQLDAEISSQENGDYGFGLVCDYYDSSISANSYKDRNFCYISGNQSKKTYSTNVIGGKKYCLYIGYTKDSSVNSGNDQFIVSNIKVILPKTIVTTDANGIATTRLKNDKTYTIKEVQSPIGYEKDESEQEVIIPSKEFRELTFKNKKIENNLTITKVDSDNIDKKLSGAEFEIMSLKDNDADETTFLAYAENGEFSENLNTWNDMLRRSYTANLNSGTAQLAEDESLYLDGNSTWTINNWQEGSFGTYEIEVAIDKDFVPVNTDNWYQASCILGCELPYKQKDFGIIIDKSGKFAIGYDTSSIYRSYINALDGRYHKIALVYSSNKIDFYIDGKKMNSIVYYPTGNEISKIGIGWNTDLASTAIKGKIKKVKIYKNQLNENKIKANANNEIYTISTVTTNDAGIIQTYIDKGKYIITETKAPDGYELNSNPETIVKEDEDISITIENTAITHQITSRVEGIGGTIEGEDEIVKRYSDSTNDIIVKPNEGYSIKYIRINGKTIDFDNTSNEVLLDKFVRVQEDIEIVAKFVEKNDYNFVLNKLDNITKAPLQNVKFEILDEDGNNARDYWGEIVGEKETINGQERYIVTTDENGQIKLKLKIGKYKAVEISNTFSFMLEEKEFEITNENIEYELSWMVTSVSFCNPNTAHIIGTKDGGMLTYVTNKTIPKDDVLAGEEILVANNEMCIAKYNKYGKVEKHIKINTQMNYFDGMYEDNDGNYIIVGSAFKMDFTEEQTVENERINFISTYGPPRFFILKLNKDLKFIWGIQSDNFYTGGNLAYISQNKDNYYNIGVISFPLASSIIIPAEQTEDNQEINIPQSGSSNLLIKCNSEGKIKSVNKTSGIPITDIKENSDGTYTVIDSNTVFEYDANLQNLSMKGVPTYGKTNKTIKLEDAGFLAPGKNVTENTIISSNYTQSGEWIQLNVNDTPSALLIKYNQEQKIIWAKSYDFSENADDEEEILSIKQDINGNYIGLVKIGSTYKLVKFDKDGNIIRIVDLPDSINPYLYTNKDNTQFFAYDNDNIYSYKLGNKDTKIKELYITNQKESSITIHHYIKPTNEEENNNLIKLVEDEKIIGKLGDEYTTKPKFDIEGYTLATDEEGNYEIPENASGTLQENNDDVNYYYEKVKSKLTIHYYLEGTENKIKEDKIQFCERGSQYEINVEDEKIDHYVYVSSSTKLEDTIEKDIEVSLYYKKEQYKIITKVAEIEGKVEKGGNITGEDEEVYEVVEYENKINSEIKATPIAGYRLRSLTINGNTAEYEKAEDGSALLNEQAPVTEDLEVVAQFEKNTGRVVVHHYIENTTQSIYDNTIFVDEVGKTIKVEPQKIEGYGLVQRPENEQIEITEGVQEVTYYYQQKVYVKTNVIEHDEKYKDGTIKQNQTGGTITGEEKEYFEELLKGRAITNNIEIKPNEGYKIVKITINSQNYVFEDKLDGEGKVTILPEELGNIEEDTTIEVEFRKKTKLYVKHIDKDTGNSLLEQYTETMVNQSNEAQLYAQTNESSVIQNNENSVLLQGSRLSGTTENTELGTKSVEPESSGNEYEEFELYESQTISINPKIILNYQNAVPTLTDEFDKEISSEFEMFADEYTVTFWYERIPSGVVERHIEIDEKGNTTQLEMKKTDGKAGLNITITRKEYDKYVPVDAPKDVTIENVTTTAKNENSVNIEYAPDEVKEVWFYYQRLCTISTQIKAHEGIETTKEGDIYQVLIKEDGTEEKVNSEEVLRGQNAKNNIKVVPNQGYRIKEITLKKVIYNVIKTDEEDTEFISNNDTEKTTQIITNNNKLKNNNAESEDIINNYFALYIEKTSNQEGNTYKEIRKEEDNQKDNQKDNQESNIDKESLSVDIIFNKIVTEEKLKLSEFINEQGEAIISIESEYLKAIDGDYTFTVEFERIPAVINIDYIDIDTQENVKDIENINVFIGDNISKILEEKMNNIEGYKLTKTVPEELPENATQEQLTIKLYYKKLFKITANQNIKEAGSIEFVDGSNEEIIQRGNENTKRIIIKTNYGYRIKNIKVNDKEIKIENLEKEENNKEENNKEENILVIKEGYFKDVQEDKNIVVEFEKSPAIIKVQYIEYSSNKVIYKTPEGKEYEEIKGYVGEEYKAEPKEIKDYELIQSKLPENASGKMTEEEIIIIYYYKKAEVKEDDKNEEKDDKKDELENKEDEIEKDNLDNKENKADKDYSEKEENNKLEEIIKSPFGNVKTGDKIIVYVGVAIITFIALGINFIISKKIKKSKEKNK